jgi:hypothetical protein
VGVLITFERYPVFFVIWAFWGKREAFREGKGLGKGWGGFGGMGWWERGIWGDGGVFGLVNLVGGILGIGDGRCV